MSKKYRCADRMCGADDCSNCHPGNFKNGRYIMDDPEPVTVTRFDVATMMMKRGGSFAKALAAAWFAGDPENRKLIEWTWEDLWERYEEMAKEDAE